MTQSAWEDLVSLNSQQEPNFTVLEPAKSYWMEDAKREEFDALGLGYEDALNRDIYPLPETRDREGYYGPHHFGYWAGGFQDATNLLAATKQHELTVNRYLDLGCASGRVIRHFPQLRPEVEVLGCDINRFHAEWCNTYLPKSIRVFHSHSIPNLPLADNSLDLVSAFSVFTHIEAFETSWLMEISRVLRPGGLAWLTVHTEKTLTDMSETWPLWKPVMNHPDIGNLLNDQRQFEGSRLVVRWRSEKSYSSNVFYKMQYLEEVWGRFFEIVEIRRRHPRFQDVLILRARK